MASSELRTYHETLLHSLGPQHWWPGDSPFEVMVGAILTQNTAWSNVEKAIANLKAAGVLSAKAIDAMDARTLARLIRPAGYFNVKAKRLKSYVRWFFDQYGGSVARMKDRPLAALREELLAVKGVGPETADSILLYAASKPTFVVDAYTHRIAVRHGWIEPEAGYDDLKDYFETRLPSDMPTLNEMHALLVEVGKNFCRPREARCDECPLKPFLPERGPILPD